MTTLTAALDTLEGLAESWRDDTAPEPHVSELLDAIAHLRPAKPADVIVMQVLLPDGEEELDVDDGFWRHGSWVVVCPIKGCTGTAFYEVDRAERWNPMRVDQDRPQPDDITEVTAWDKGRPIRTKVRPNPLAGLPVMVTSQGSDGDGYATHHYQCQSCGGEVELPKWLESEWS